MPERVISVWAHTAVLMVLIALTVGTAAFSFVDVSGTWHRAVAVGIAALQSALIVLFFMHALTSPKVTWCVIAVSLFWMAGVLFLLTFADYATRSSFPHVPGH